MKRAMTTEEARLVGENAWLHFYNRVLHERGIITDEQFIRMKNRITIRKAASNVISTVNADNSSGSISV